MNNQDPHAHHNTGYNTGPNTGHNPDHDAGHETGHGTDQQQDPLGADPVGQAVNAGQAATDARHHSNPAGENDLHAMRGQHHGDHAEHVSSGHTSHETHDDQHAPRQHHHRVNGPVGPFRV